GCHRPFSTASNLFLRSSDRRSSASHCASKGTGHITGPFKYPPTNLTVTTSTLEFNRLIMASRRRSRNRRSGSSAASTILRQRSFPRVLGSCWIKGPSLSSARQEVVLGLG